MADETEKNETAEKAPAIPRLRIENVPGIPDMYPDELTPSERRSLERNNPGIYADIVLKEKLHAEQHSGKAKAVPAAPVLNAVPEGELYKFTNTPEKLAAYNRKLAGEEAPEAVDVTIKLPEQDTDDVPQQADVTVKSGESVIAVSEVPEVDMSEVPDKEASKPTASKKK